MQVLPCEAASFEVVAVQEVDPVPYLDDHSNRPPIQLFDRQTVPSPLLLQGSNPTPLPLGALHGEWCALLLCHPTLLCGNSPIQEAALSWKTCACKINHQSSVNPLVCPFVMYEKWRQMSGRKLYYPHTYFKVSVCLSAQHSVDFITLGKKMCRKYYFAVTWMDKIPNMFCILCSGKAHKWNSRHTHKKPKWSLLLDMVRTHMDNSFHVWEHSVFNYMIAYRGMVV